MTKTYLGDGVFIEMENLSTGITLTTNDGIEDKNRIILEEEVLVNLLKYLKRME